MRVSESARPIATSTSKIPGLTGMPVSPGIFEVLVAMGRELALTRVDAAIDFLKRAS